MNNITLSTHPSTHSSTYPPAQLQLSTQQQPSTHSSSHSSTQLHLSTQQEPSTHSSSHSSTQLQLSKQQEPYKTLIVKSEKRIARELRNAKKQQNQRTQEERKKEVDKIFEKINELGIPPIMLGEFPQIANDFVNFGYGASGIIKITDIHRELVYLLSNNKRHECGAMLHKY